MFLCVSVCVCARTYNVFGLDVICIVPFMDHFAMVMPVLTQRMNLFGYNEFWVSWAECKKKKTENEGNSAYTDGMR